MKPEFDSSFFRILSGPLGYGLILLLFVEDLDDGKKVFCSKN
jgi:hypothetical protein